MSLFEGIIVAAPKDYTKVRYVAQSLLRNAIGIGTVHVISPDKFDPRLRDVKAHADSEVLDFDRSKFKYRPNWVFQQFLKLFQNVTESDYYLVTDADIMLNNPQTFFEYDQPVFILARNQNHGEYFNYSERMIGIGKVFPWSFLSEMTFYSKHLVRDMVSYSGQANIPDFLERSAQIIDAGCYPAEAELYGSYVTKLYPDLYRFRYVSHAMHGKYQAEPWTDDEIRALIRIEGRKRDCDIFTMHSWEGNE